VNYYGARQVRPDATDRPDAGRWRFTVRNDDRIWPTGACADGCPGHETAEEACEHWVNGEIDKGLIVHECSWTSCEVDGCDQPARKILYVGGVAHGGGYPLCDEHAVGEVAVELFRARHPASFTMIASW
jgi:hypothetical protein